MWTQLARASLLLLLFGATQPGCSPVLGIEEKECGGCATESSRLVCENGVAREVPCPGAGCAKGVCTAGQCSLVPAVGQTCGESGVGTCNDSGVCVGPDMKLAALRRHACLLTQDAAVWCWGDNQWGEVGDGTLTPATRATRVVGLPPDRQPVNIGVGYGQACAVMDDGTAWCWGNNLAGQCGASPSDYELAPVPVPLPGVKLVSITGGYAHTCALSDQGALHCWGYNNEGQCGAKDAQLVAPSITPVLVDVVKFDVNKSHNCALRKSGSGLECWGRNQFSQLGKMPAGLPWSSAPVPIEIEDGGQKVSVVDVALGYDSTLAVGSNGRTYAWGFNSNGQLGIGSTKDVYTWTPTVVVKQDGTPLLGGFSAYRSDGSDGCVRTEYPGYPHQFFCFGANSAGELGLGTYSKTNKVHPSAEPAEVIPNATVDLVHGEDFACMLLPATVAASGLYEVQCFGDAAMMAVGAPPSVGGTTYIPTPMPAPIQWNSELAPPGTPSP